MVKETPNVKVILVVNESQGVFPNEITGLPPEEEIELLFIWHQGLHQFQKLCSE